MKKPKKPARESLAWYRSEWRKMAGKDIPMAMIDGLAQLSYENKRLRRRVDDLERVALEMMLGIVNVRGVKHLLSCAKIRNESARCTCGSQPEGVSKAS